MVKRYLILALLSLFGLNAVDDVPGIKRGWRLMLQDQEQQVIEEFFGVGGGQDVGRQKIQCPHEGCDKVYNGPQAKAILRSHIKAMHSGEIKRLECPYEGCSAVYTGMSAKSSLNVHIKAVHSGEVKRLECFHEVCKAVYTGSHAEKNLRRHIKAMHSSDVAKEPCPYKGCNKVYTAKGSLMEHIRVEHSGADVIRLGCLYGGCKAVYTGVRAKSNLSEHIKAMHSDEVIRLGCPYEGCKAVYTGVRAKRSLNGHINKVHSGLYSQSEVADVGCEFSEDCTDLLGGWVPDFGVDTFEEDYGLLGEDCSHPNGDDNMFLNSELL